MKKAEFDRPPTYDEAISQTNLPPYPQRPVQQSTSQSLTNYPPAGTFYPYAEPYYPPPGQIFPCTASAPYAPPHTTTQAMNFPLAHVDFWPKCLNGIPSAQHGGYEIFSQLIKEANAWLYYNQGYDIVNSETVQKKVCYVHDIYDGKMSWPRQNTSTMWVHGLRLWIRSINEFRIREIGSIDFVPNKIASSGKFGEFERMETLIERANQTFEANQLNGIVISIDTVRVSAPAKYVKAGIDPLQTSYIDEHKKHCYHFLRVFYIRGSPNKNYIGISDFLPQELPSGMKMPNFENHQTVMQKVTAWVGQTKEVTVTNIQTRDTGYLTQSGVIMDPRCTAEFDIDDRYRVRYIRVAYVTGALTPPPQQLTCYMFVPQPIGQCGKNVVFESAVDCIKRISAWLLETRGHVICAETHFVVEDNLRKMHLPGADLMQFRGEYNYDLGIYLQNALVDVIRVYVRENLGKSPPQTTMNINSANCVMS